MTLSRIVGNVAYRVMQVTAKRSQGRTTDLVIEHEITGVAPEMIDWWWDNIDDCVRYALWHPGSHISFAWEEKREGEHAGTVQLVLERIGPVPVALRIRWEEPDAVEIPIEFGHVNVASVLGADDEPLSWLVHQYEAMGEGVRMRSTFRLPARTPRWFLRGLAKHNREEMARLPDFLPGLYSAEARPS